MTTKMKVRPLARSEYWGIAGLVLLLFLAWLTAPWIHATVSLLRRIGFIHVGLLKRIRIAPPSVFDAVLRIVVALATCFAWWRRTLAQKSERRADRLRRFELAVGKPLPSRDHKDAWTECQRLIDAKLVRLDEDVVSIVRRMNALTSRNGMTVEEFAAAKRARNVMIPELEAAHRAVEGFRQFVKKFGFFAPY